MIKWTAVAAAPQAFIWYGINWGSGVEIKWDYMTFVNLSGRWCSLLTSGEILGGIFVLVYIALYSIFTVAVYSSYYSHSYKQVLEWKAQF